MENLSKYIGKDLKGIIGRLSVVQGTAKGSGNTYYAIDIDFINGFKKRIFLQGAENFAWTNAIEQLETQAQVNAQF